MQSIGFPCTMVHVDGIILCLPTSTVWLQKNNVCAILSPLECFVTVTAVFHAGNLPYGDLSPRHTVLDP